MLELLLIALLQTPAPPMNSMKTIDGGALSAIDAARQVVVRTAAEWAALWNAHAPDRPLPDVDFTKSVVAGVFAGTRPTGGYSVTIVRARDERGTLVVQYVEARPGADAVAAQILTAPYHLVALPAHPGPIRFERVEK
jgi:hypothetical protein